jgi:tRNA/tmRNA/rRNA uracil-C5-methylase (TrmA/RlmC/RlmD family)
VTLTVGARLILTIADIAFGGEGVARLEEFVIFVPFVLVGEVVEAELTEVKKRFGRARLVRVIEGSPDRVMAPCRYFGECGGCQYQHIVYAAQLRLKLKQIQDLFQRIGGFSPGLISPVLPCPQPYGYRNRIMVRTQWDKFKQGLNLGYIRADNRLVIDIEECLIAEPALNARIQEIRAHPPPKGGLKVVLRIPPEGWEVPPDSFFQNNFFLLPKLVEVVRELVQSGAARHLVDVYCGVGFFSLELADLVEGYTGVELDKLAIQAARRNAASRRVLNGEFVAGTAEELLPGLLERFKPETTCVLLDPPRKGCRPELLELLRRVKPAQIIYVSCDPATMARDLNVLSTADVFRLARVVPLDMFPQTAHVESVADVRRNEALPISQT